MSWIISQLVFNLQRHKTGLTTAFITFTALVSTGSYPPHASAALLAGQNGKIAFEGVRNGNTDIYLVNPDGSGQVDLTPNDPGDEQNPSWSPDGTKLVFEAVRGGSSDIYVINADGSGEVNVTNSTQNEKEPDWSPDGTKITFVSDGAIYVMNADGTRAVPLSTSSSQAVAWSPDGSKLAYTVVSDLGRQSAIYLMNADGSDQHVLTSVGGGAHAAWSPDGSRLVYEGYEPDKSTDLFTINADGSNRVNVTNTGLTVFERDPSFSPDGKRIVFANNSLCGLETIAIDGSDRQPVFRDCLFTFINNPAWQTVNATILRGGCNGESCDDGAKLFVNSQAKLQKQAGKPRFQRSGFAVSGRLLNTAGQPIRNATVDILQNVTLAGSSPKKIGETKTDGSGNWKTNVAKGPSRAVQVAYRSYQNDAKYAVVADVITQKVTGQLSFVLPKRAKRGKRLTLKGKLFGGFVPDGGKVIELQVFYRRQWRTFKTLRTKNNGNYTLRFSFGNRYEPGVYRFRSRVRFSRDWPFLGTTSKPRKITIR